MDCFLDPDPREPGAPAPDAPDAPDAPPAEPPCEARLLERLRRAGCASAQPVVEQLSSRQRAADRRLELLLVADARGRVAGTLAELAGRQGQRCPHGHEVDVPLTQGELAQLAGLSRQVTSATLNALREEGLIDYTRDHLCVNDLRALGAAALSST